MEFSLTAIAFVDSLYFGFSYLFLVEIASVVEGESAGHCSIDIDANE